MFLKILSSFPGDLFSEHLWMALNKSEYPEVNNVYAKSIEKELKRWNYVFFWSGISKFTSNTKPCPLLWEGTIFQVGSTLKLSEKRRKSCIDNSGPQIINNISTSTRSIPHTYHHWVTWKSMNLIFY